MEQIRGESSAASDFNLTLLVIFAGVALLLAAIGIYGLMAYSVQQRTQEIGIRLALGASSQEVRAMVVKQGMALAVAGVVIGVVAALGLTRLMATLLSGVTPRDPLAITLASLLLIVVALAATYLPARRATSRSSGVFAIRVTPRQRLRPASLRISAFVPSVHPANSLPSWTGRFTKAFADIAVFASALRCG